MQGADGGSKIGHRLGASQIRSNPFIGTMNIDGLLLELERNLEEAKLSLKRMTRLTLHATPQSRLTPAQKSRAC